MDVTQDNTEPVRADEIQGMWAYIQQINFREPWLIALGVFHLICFLITACTRNNSVIQGVHFIVLLSLVYFAEPLNEWAAKSWRLFAHQQYFDSSGLFVSVVFSTPVLVNCLVIVVLWLKDMSTMLSETRLLKEAWRARMKSKEEKADSEQNNEESKKEK